MVVNLSADLASSISLLVESGRYPSVDAAIDAAARLLPHHQPPSSTRPMTQDEFDQHLIAIGMMARRADSEADFDDPDDVPIEIEGEPLSQTVIRERR